MRAILIQLTMQVAEYSHHFKQGYYVIIVGIATTVKCCMGGQLALPHVFNADFRYGNLS